VIALARIAGRGFVQVVLVSANTFQVAHAHYLGMAIVGFLISVVWWTNARATGRNDDVAGAALAYGLGAAIGTLTGASVMAWWYATPGQ